MRDVKFCSTVIDAATLRDLGKGRLEFPEDFLRVAEVPELLDLQTRRHRFARARISSPMVL